MQLTGKLAPRYVHTWLGLAPHVVSAEVVGHTVRYVLASGTPAWFLKSGMSGFLYDYRFGEKGRRMVVRLLDGRGRFAWAAGYDGGTQTWARTRSDLANCGPIWDSEGGRLPRATGAADERPCPVEPRPKGTILR